jgi:ribosome biogenesis GTPase A
MALAQLQKPWLLNPATWFPGHMMKFRRELPSLLSQTDVLLELRDSRLPLTSINRNFEGGATFSLTQYVPGGVY